MIPATLSEQFERERGVERGKVAMDEKEVRVSFANEWRRAQAITLTIPDLVTAAKQQLRFLARVSQNPELTQAGPALDRAIRRYEACWLPLLASQEKCGSALVPPLDCAWIWHCHRLNPIRYAQDCKALHGKVLAAAVPEASCMVIATESTVQLWKRRYPTVPYDHHRLACFGKTRNASRRRISYNLVEAVLRQVSFYYQVSELHVRQESFLRAAELRYKGFLHLAAKAKGKLFLVPTYDIDFMWHTHQLDVTAYRTDTRQILGKVLDHDDTGTESKLSVSFQETKQLWEETYGLPFEKAGAMYRGEAPTSLELSCPLDLLQYGNETSSIYKREQEAQYCFLTSRESVQLCVNILGVKNIKTDSRVFVRLKGMNCCGNFKLNTPEVDAGQPRWKQSVPWRLTLATSVKGIILELRMNKTCLGLKRKSVILGEVHVPFHLLLASPTLSAHDWLPLHNDDQIWDLNKKPPAIEIAVSIAPSVPAPYLLRAVNAKTTDDDFREVTEFRRRTQTGRWLTRTVLDHRGTAVYTVRIRKSKGSKRVIPVTESERIVDVSRPNLTAKPGDPRTVLAASAIQLMDTTERTENATLQRQWALFDRSTIFTVKKNRDPEMDEYPELTVAGNVGYTVGLISGRWLQYQIRGSQPEEERGFVTVVRFTPECPTGKATALFNWMSATMEVTPGENATFVVLLSTVTSLAVHDLLGTMSERPSKVTKRRSLPDKSQWGAVIVESGPRSEVEIGGPSSATRLWWTMNSQGWAQEIYGTTSAGCGGAGACGGGACAPSKSDGNGGCLAPAKTSGHAN